jgi:hypothetical protein
MKKESHLYRWVPSLSSCGSAHNVGLFHLKNIQGMIICVHSSAKKVHRDKKLLVKSTKKNNPLTRLVENPPYIYWKIVGYISLC